MLLDLVLVFLLVTVHDDDVVHVGGVDDGAPGHGAGVRAAGHGAGAGVRLLALLTATGGVRQLLGAVLGRVQAEAGGQLAALPQLQHQLCVLADLALGLEGVVPLLRRFAAAEMLNAE